MQAWSDGAANHGWVLLPPLATSTDNFAFSPAEADTAADRPQLRVEWVPASTLAASFRQGVGGYAGTVDTQLSQNAPTANNSAIVDLFSDWTDNQTTPNETQVLLRFDNIIGTGIGQIPSGSTVHAAVLTLPGMGSNNTPGDGGKFHTMLVPWAATDNWNTFTDGVQANGIEAGTAYSAQAGYAERNPNAQAGIHNFEVTADVQKWLDGTLANHGWAILPWPGGSDGWAISSAETATVAYRPQLNIYYSPPPGITVSVPSSPTTSENGASATFTVVLNAQPTADVNIGVSSGDVTEGSVAPGTLAFTSLNWNQPQTVTVTGLDDDLRDGPVAYSVVIAAAVSTDARYNGIDAPDPSFTNLDNDTPGITVSAPSGPSTTEAGGTVTFTIVLDSQPAADVTIGLSSSDTTEGTVSPTGVTFTSVNWATPQVLTVTGVDDSIADGNVAYTIVTAAAISGDAEYNGLNAADVSLTNLNDDATGGAFGPGNIVVYRVGDGVAGLVNTGSAVFLDEYTPSGTYVRSIALPTAVNGSQKQLIASGTATSEGLLTRSADSQYLVLTGYAANLGGATGLAGTASVTVNRTVGRVTADGNVDTSTALTDFSDGNNPRGAASTNGADLWMTGGAGGVRYAALGSTTSTQLSTTVTNLRAVDVFGGQLHVSTASGSAVRIGTVGTGTPTTSGQTITNLPGFPSSGGGPYGFLLADLDPGVAGVDTLYVADDTALALGKYSLVGGSWVSNGTIGVDADDYRGVTGVVNGTTVTIYATRKGGSGAAGGGELVTLADTSGYNGAFSGTPTLLATAGANTAFRGVALVPVTPPGVTIAQTGGSTDVAEGGATDSYTVVLNSQPAADVTITLTPDAQVTGNPTTLTFTSGNWNMPQTVTVTAVDDNVFEGNHTGTITHSATSSDTNYNGASVEVTIQITDNDSLQVQNVVINDGGIQRSKVTSINVQFNANVQIAAGAFEVKNRTTGAIVNLNVQVNGSLVVLTFADGPSVEATDVIKSLADGRYELNIDAEKVTAHGSQLDGDGDGTGGDDYQFVDRFFRLFGDVNGDGVVGMPDFNIFRSAFGKAIGDPLYRWELDFQGDGLIGMPDFNAFRSRFGKSV
ncbi:MAG: DNRLRE domain-containing protein [Planctomycetes bacterium]|nr:DNRLRE domain-containing protein [Planctomycetota bacterium]